MSAPTKAEKRTLLIVFLTVFLDLIGFGIIIPIQPFLAESLGASPTVVTLLGASFSLMQFLFAPVWGRLSDRVGRRPIMLVSIAFSCFGYLLFGFAESLPLLFAARMLAGLGGANIGTAQAIIADSTTPERRSKGMGLIGAAFGLGFIFGPALGGGFSQISLSAPAFVASGLCAINWIFAFLKLPETRMPGASGKVKASHAAFSWQALKHAARHANVPQLFILYGFYFMAFSLMEQDLGLFVEHHWVKSGSGKEAARLTMYILIVVGVTATMVQGGLIGRLTKMFTERRLLQAGNLLVAVTFALIPFIGMTGMYPLMMVNALFMATGSGLVHPSLSSLLSQAVDADERGGALGLGQSLAGLGRVIGPAVAGYLFELHPGAPFWIASAVIVFCTGVAFQIKPKQQTGSASPS